MSALVQIRLRTLGWFVALPVPIVCLLPWWLSRQADGPFRWQADPVQWAGLWLILNGLGLAGWCVNLFNVQGQGTPVPLDPPRRFVATGPYRFVRNPMVLGLWLVLLGESALYRSQAILWYTLCLMVLATAFVRYWEEPDLERRFGETYRAYRRQVPAWIPRPPTNLAQSWRRYWGRGVR